MKAVLKVVMNAGSMPGVVVNISRLTTLNNNIHPAICVSYRYNTITNCLGPWKLGPSIADATINVLGHVLKSPVGSLKIH